MTFWSFYVACGFIKISIVFFYMRLSGFSSKAWKIFHWCFVVFLAAFALVSFCLNIFQCNPPYANWDYMSVGKNLGPENPPKCLPYTTLTSGPSVIHVLSDFALLIVPIVMLKDTKLKFTVKLRVWIAGVVGCSSCICSVFRVIAQYRIATDDITCIASQNQAQA